MAVEHQVLGHGCNLKHRKHKDRDERQSDLSTDANAGKRCARKRPDATLVGPGSRRLVVEEEEEEDEDEGRRRRWIREEWSR